MSEETVQADEAAVAGETAHPGDGADLTQETEDVLEALRDVVDPELGVNVVDLGLGYGVTLGGDGVPAHRRDRGAGRLRAGGPGHRLSHQLGMAAPVGTGQDHRRRPRATPRAG